MKINKIINLDVDLFSFRIWPLKYISICTICIQFINGSINNKSLFWFGKTFHAEYKYELSLLFIFEFGFGKKEFSAI
jgi:hypothetical protein